MLLALLLVMAVACGAAEKPAPTTAPAAAKAPVAAAPVPTTAPAAAPAKAPAATAVPTVAPASAGAVKPLLLRAPEANPKRGGILKFGGQSDPAHFDLHGCATIACINPQSNMYDNLVRFNPFDYKTIIPDLAHKWEISKDGLTYTFFLRDGVKFHDGALLTSEDVKATFDRIIFPPPGFISERKGLFSAVAEVKALDPLTVQFVLKEPRGFMPQAIGAGWNIIVRKKTLEDNNFDLKRVRNFPGTGPFKFVDWKVGESLKVERFKDYWNPELPYLDGIHVFQLRVGPDTGAALQAKNIDYAYGMDPETAKRAATTPGLRASVAPLANYQALWPNLKRKPFDDIRVRRAIHLVLDRPAMLDIVTDLRPFDAGGWVPAADPLGLTARERTSKLPGWRVDKAEDIKEAQRLMAEAGYAGGFKAEMLVRDVAWFIRWAPVIQDTLKRQLKIDVTIRQTAFAVWYEEAQKGNFDLTISGTASTLEHAADYWSLIFQTGASQNWVGYSNPKFDTISSQITREADPQKLQELLVQGSDILEQDLPVFNIGHVRVPYGWWDYVKGHRDDVRIGIYNVNRFDTVWLDK
jgi:ABC-type transport system substrate-binding protein